jgi:hypothetical protein
VRKGKIIGTEVAAIKPSHQARPELLVQVVNLPLHPEIWENVADVGALVGGR